MRHCLVVAHQTLDSPRLEDAMLEELGREPCTFYLVVPILNPGDGLTWTELQIRALAQERLNQALSNFRASGYAIDGEIGGPSPVESVDEVVQRDGPDAYDLILVSTLPHAVSRWLKIDAPSRIARRTGIRVRHVEAPDRVLR
jgi:hypothetical protein